MSAFVVSWRKIFRMNSPDAYSAESPSRFARGLGPSQREALRLELRQREPRRGQMGDAQGERAGAFVNPDAAAAPSPPAWHQC